jgi:NTP pyrophosphatase (non-canonical NTP hydrolase)
MVALLLEMHSTEYQIVAYLILFNVYEFVLSCIVLHTPLYQNVVTPKKTIDMTINEAQVKVDEWIKTFGVRYFNELTNTAILMEEVGEVARIMARKYGEQSFKESEKDIELADEMADVLFVLICLANQTGIDLESALTKNLDKKTQRDSNRHKLNDKL